MLLILDAASGLHLRLIQQRFLHALSSESMMNDSGKDSFESSKEILAPEPTYVILGVQGSGTNFISQLMTRALRFSVVIDRSLIFNAAVKVCQDPVVATAEREATRVCRSLFPGAIRKRLLPRKYFRQANNYQGIKAYLHLASTGSSADFADFFYCYHAFVGGGKHKAIKSDDIWQNLSYLEEIIPNYRIVLLVRDPRDNALSVASKNFGPRDVYFAAKYVRFQLETYASLLNDSPDRVVCLRYEDLLADPVPEIERLAGFVGEPFTPEVIDHVEQFAVKRDNSFKWKKLHRKDLIALESVLREQIVKFGYECGTDNDESLSCLEIARRSAFDVALRVPQKVAAKTARLLYG